MLSQQVIDTVKATAPVLAEHGEQITQLFYTKLFNAHPELKDIFNIANQAKGEQQRALADAVIAYAVHIEKLEALGPAVNRIAHKHASLQISPQHYPIVGKYLLAAIAEHLSLADNDPIVQAWAQAYQALATIFIDAEENIYSENEQKLGGWRGFRAFEIVELVDEAHGIKSFYLKPVDGGPVATWSAGQYVGVKVNPPGSEYTEIRQYSLSNAPNNDIYRLTIRAEKMPDSPDGMVSNYLHNLQLGDRLELQPPTGDFFASDDDPAAVLIAGGVGITPLLSILMDRINRKKDVGNITFIQCCRDNDHHIKAEELKALQRKYGFRYLVSYEHGDDGDFQGYLNPQILKTWLPDNERNVYFCGPKAFMSAIYSALHSIGFKADKLHYETFGPKLAL